ncbi:MAG: hypothetical protein UT55_C0023G0006 [Candidatus Peregrinibacteria bacterium GW2011_GWE2_39_6]|nr:MAG: hypothetical protein UT36_C0013G0011 [Candidatus Peregrinibacteria bacterium GW2011_GWF2_39_17]KKR25960.1 MAG: hypothetical protein UT55_C0023G0006 [Candidatus Peregrinibacteria bacterium GW2011_GWE2_39_6]HCW32461.1 hypothetical protein [Candidatus Peregrinibacteria bacterium]
MPLPSLKIALTNLKRNKILTLATVLVISLILFIFNIIFSVNLLAQETLQNLKNKVDLILYLKDDADILTVNRLVEELKTRPDIQEVHYISKEEALQSLLEKYPQEINPFSNYDLDNPLPGSIQIITQNPQDHQTVQDSLQNSSYASLFSDINTNLENQQITNQLIDITYFSEKLLWGILFAFIMGSGLVIANAIHINIFYRRKEIEIMKLVGATPTSIRAPFILEGAFYGLGSSFLSLILLLIFMQTLEFKTVSFTHLDFPYFYLFVVELITAIAIGVASSLAALHPMLKKP